VPSSREAANAAVRSRAINLHYSSSELQSGNDNESRRERRIAARRAQILSAAETVFSQKGYERATTREIAETADISEGTLYNYFGSKSELLSAVAQSFGDGIAREIADIEAESPHDMMSQLLTARLRSGRERRLLMLFLYEARLNPEVHRQFIQHSLQRIIAETERRFEQWAANGVIRTIDPALAARAISATIMGFAALYEMGQYGNEKNGFSPERWGRELSDLFLDGLRKQDFDEDGSADAV
jgi:AcrR family transcriptional regulator